MQAIATIGLDIAKSVSGPRGMIDGGRGTGVQRSLKLECPRVHMEVPPASN
jgi:hypothetical protein